MDGEDVEFEHVSRQTICSVVLRGLLHDGLFLQHRFLEGIFVSQQHVDELCRGGGPAKYSDLSLNGKSVGG